MVNKLKLYKTRATPFAALMLVGVFYMTARQPTASEGERERLAANFHFTKSDVSIEVGSGPLPRVRRVHPSLERISAWISATGAAATTADLDGDGLPNDLCLVDPRVNLAIVRPVPTTGQRYEAFSLHPSPLPYDADRMAPTGSVVGDFNEDGNPDILVYYWGRTPVLFLHRPTSSLEPTGVSAAMFAPCELVQYASEDGPPRWYTHAASQADVDGDGHVDLVLGNFFQDGADILNADGTGIATVMQAGKSKASNGGGAKLFLWRDAHPGVEPNVRYQDRTEVLEKLCGRGWVLAIGATDLDLDGLPELYLAHDFGPDRLLHNCSRPGELKFVVCEGSRSFTTPKSFVLGHDSFKGMGIDFGDVNADGYPDIFVSNIADEWALQESHFVWTSTGRIDKFQAQTAPYVQSSEALGLSRSGWGWDSKFADFDNDGTLEVMQATGFITGGTNCWPELQALGTSNDRIVNDPRCWPAFRPGADISGHDPNPFFVRGADGRFVDVSAEVGVDSPEAPMNSRGIAIDDVDGDGRLDFVVANQWSPSYYFHNESPTEFAFLGLHLLLPISGEEDVVTATREGHPCAATPGRPAFGARAKVHLSGNRVLAAQVDGGNGHAGRRSPALHFGLGDVAPDETLSVDLAWRDINGCLRDQTVQVQPGWHTIVLGNPMGRKVQ